jgi:hypothetical protein
MRFRFRSDDEDDRHRRGRCSLRAAGDDGRRTTLDQFGRQSRQPMVVAICPTIFGGHVLTFDMAGFLEPLGEGSDEVRKAASGTAAYETEAAV